MSAPQNRNHAVHRAVSSLVHDYLQSEGIPVKHYPRPTPLVDLSDEVHADVDAAGLAITVSSKLRHRLSEDLDAAVGVANLSGSPVGVLLQWRANKPIPGAYAIVTLRDLATLVKTARGTTEAAPDNSTRSVGAASRHGTPTDPLRSRSSGPRT